MVWLIFYLSLINGLVNVLFKFDGLVHVLFKFNGLVNVLFKFDGLVIVWSPYASRTFTRSLLPCPQSFSF